MKKISILLESRCSAASLLKSLRILPLILLQYCLINAAPDLHADNGGSNSSGFWISESSGENFSSIVQLKLLVALPLDQTRNYEDPNIQIWDRGLEMLPGAQLAVEAINKDPRLLTGYELKLENVSIEPCIDQEEQTNAFIPFTNGTLDDNTVGIVGLFCYKLLRTLSPLAGRREFGLFQLSGTTSTDIRGNRERYSHLNFAVPSESAYYETFFRLMNALGWRRALIIDDNFPNMIHIPNFTILTQNLNISDLEFSDNVILMANEIRRSEKNIVFMSTSTRQTASLLCAVYDYKLLWPHYVWVLQDHEINELLRYAQGAECTTKKLTVSLQNTFFLRSQHKQKNVSKELVTGSTYETYMQQYTEILNKSGGGLKYNRFANTMHDSVWAFALALNHSLDALATYNANVVDFVEEFGREELTNIIEDNIRSLSFEGVSGRVEFNQEYDILAFVDILHASISGELLTVGHYNYRNITINRTLLPSDLPPDSLPNIYYRIPFPVTVLLVVLVVFCFVFTTFTLVLFIKYRRYSEIKATSPYLSLLMFVGTYFILTSTLIQAISTVVVSQADNVVSKILCGSVITGNIVGINLIFSTLLLRMLRIYRIFSYFGKTGKLWSDKVLVIIVLIIVGTDLLLILIWFFADPFTVKNSISYKPNAYPPYYEIRQFCSSKEIGVWFSLTFGKVAILFAIVLFLAIKTRKIQRANFKDTKKVNIYIFITVLIVAILIPLWFFLKETGNVIWTGVVIYTSFGVIGLLCQFFLFAPKVLPPLLRSLGFSKAYHSVRNRYHQETIRKYDDDYESTMFKYTLNSVTPRYSFIS